MADDADITAHVRSYDALIRLFKRGMIAVAIVVALVVYIISR